jgi:hypothetical protein
LCAISSAPGRGNICAGRNNDLASLHLLLPIRATEEFRANTGEFLHLLIYSAERNIGGAEMRIAAEERAKEEKIVAI